MIHKSKLSNKFLLSCCIVFLIFIIACSTTFQSITPTGVIPTFDPNSFSTLIAQTANAALTQTAPPKTPTFTPTPTSISFRKSPTPDFISSPSAGSFKFGDPTATPLGSDITDPDFIAGVKAHAAKDYEQAVTLMSSTINTNPNLAPPYRYRGISYWYLGKCEEALNDFDQALSINQDYAAAWAGHGLASDCLGDQDQMLLDYQKALSLDPSLAYVHHNLGVYYYGNGDYEKSLQEYTLSASIDPRRSDSWSGRAEALSGLGQYGECIVSANKALEINPQEWHAYSDRALCENYMENYKAAIADLQTFIDNSTADASIWNNLGVYQESNGELEAAMKSYNKALELDSNYYYAYINRGNTFVEMKKYQEALADFNKALESGEIPVAYAGRGDVYYGLGKYDKAVENYNKAVELYPFSAHTYCYLSLSYFELEKYQDSIDAAQSSIQINKKCGEKKLYEIQARSYYGLKDYDQGILYINKALAMGNYAFGHYYRGIIYQAMGRDQEAIQDLEFFINSVTHSEENQIEIADAEKRLAKLKK